jgi:hypothetical protein
MTKGWIGKGMAAIGANNTHTDTGTGSARGRILRPDERGGGTHGHDIVGTCAGEPILSHAAAIYEGALAAAGDSPHNHHKAARHGAGR